MPTCAVYAQITVFVLFVIDQELQTSHYADISTNVAHVDLHY